MQPCLAFARASIIDPALHELRALPHCRRKFVVTPVVPESDFGAWAALLLAGAASVFGGFAFGAAGESATRGEPAKLEIGEELPGGGATSLDDDATSRAFTHPAHGMDLESDIRFKLGNAIFRRLWVVAPSSTTSADGLGPLYNARSCQSCHLRDGRGQPPSPTNPDEPSLILRLSVPPRAPEERKLIADLRIQAIPDPVYGLQLQTSAIKGLDAEGTIAVTYRDEPVRLGDGEIVDLRVPSYAIGRLKYGPMRPDVHVSPRVAPQMIGLGLLEAIPEAAIRASADPDDADQDGISGRTSDVRSNDANRLALGRFGWKAAEASVRSQSGVAAAIDIGLSNPVAPSPAGDCTPSQAPCLNAPDGNSERGNDYELAPELLDLLTHYSRNLAVPVRRDPANARVLRGKGLFHSLGCTACHTPSHRTGVVDGEPHLSDQLIWPYTDLLLHDMGDGLADGRPEGSANGREWRTAPLWGIGLTDVVSGHTRFLHDGRARSIQEAILWHGGEAKAARDAFTQMSKDERDALIAFVNSL